MPLRIDVAAPDFEADAAAGRIRFYDLVGNSWCVIFSHPKDFAPVSATELGRIAKIEPHIDESATAGYPELSVDTIDKPRTLVKEHRGVISPTPTYPIVGDGQQKTAKTLPEWCRLNAWDTALWREPTERHNHTEHLRRRAGPRRSS